MGLIGLAIRNIWRNRLIKNIWTLYAEVLFRRPGRFDRCFFCQEHPSSTFWTPNTIQSFVAIFVTFKAMLSGTARNEVMSAAAFSLYVVNVDIFLRAVPTIITPVIKLTIVNILQTSKECHTNGLECWALLSWKHLSSSRLSLTLYLTQ